MHTIQFTQSFKITRKALVKGNKEKEKREEKTLHMLMQDPFYPSLKSHKVVTRNFGQCWSSRITGDLRLLWKFDEEKKLIILLLAIASHSGGNKEYK